MVEAETLLSCISLYRFTFILLLNVHGCLDLVKKGEEWGDGPLLTPRVLERLSAPWHPNMVHVYVHWVTLQVSGLVQTPFPIGR